MAHAHIAQSHEDGAEADRGRLTFALALIVGLMAVEIAAGVVYLASDEAAYVTGHTLHINGGMAMI